MYCTATTQCVCHLGSGFHSIISPPVPTDGDFMPAVIIWNPFLVYSQNILQDSIKCLECGGSIEELYWNDGSSGSRQPRLLHGLEDVVYLVSAVYACKRRHKILSHDPAILSLLPKEVVPFVLSHQTGITMELFEMCTSLCRRGMTFYDMESFILERRWEYHIKKQNLLKKTPIQSVSSDIKDSTDFWKSPSSNSPSNNILVKCFLSGFLQDEQLYLQEMESIPVGQSISFDHTFKIASNIGYVREDSRWITVYDSVFLVLNADGKVITWQLTKGTTFDEVTVLLQNLASRSNGNLKNIYVDDCCKLRKKIENVFGNNVSVKLDLFHAIQRITKTLPKKHVHTLQCLQDLRLVFRCDGDSGEKRLSTTPSPEKILQNLKEFIQKWQYVVDYNNFKLFNHETVAAIERLKKHISLGCLSNIPAGHGTNRNERLHQLIAKYFNRSRIGILLAYALLTVILHSNNATMKFRGKAVSKPISASQAHKTLTMSTRPMGIMPKEQANTTDKECACDHWEQSTTENDEHLHLIITIYQKSVQKYQIVKGLQKAQVSKLNDYIHAFKEFKIYDLNKGENSLNHHENLNKYGLTVLSTTPNGNCFFQAVAINIKANANRWTELGTMDAEPLSYKLRQIFVEEVTGDNRPSYEEFIPSAIDYTTEVQKFLESGFYDHALGDLMPLAIATALKAYIVIIISGCQHHPTYVTPLAGKPTEVIFLLYNPTGPGHYDAVVPYIYTMNDSKAFIKEPQKKGTSCSCGVNGNNLGKSCAPNQSYASRCKCYQNSNSCTSHCRCKDCSNPCGKKPLPELTRKRRSHSLQTEVPSSKKFAEGRGEALPTNSWSTFETIVLSEVENCNENMEDLETGQLYNKIVHYSKSNFCTLPLEDEAVFRSKTAMQIASKLKHMLEHAKI